MYYAPTIQTGDRPSRQHTILIVDDSHDTRALLSRMLRSRYHVLTACNVDSALNILSDIHPDLVITDYDMPGKNGLTGLKEIRRIYPDIHVIMLTGSVTRELAQEALHQGADECLAKPFEPEAIRERIQYHLENHAA